MKLLIGIIWMIQIYEYQCSIFQNIRVDTENDGTVLAVLADLATNSKPLEIRFNIQEIDLAPRDLQNQPASGRKKSGTLRVIEDCALSNPYQQCRQTEDGIRLLVHKIDEHCQSFNYSSADGALAADINIAGIHLYGGAEHINSQWPVDKLKYVRNSYVTKNEHFQAILEPYWLTSNGYYIYVDEVVPLFISLDPQTRSFQLIAENTVPYVKRNADVVLNFIVCKFENARVAHEHAVKHVLGTPSAVPDLNRVKYPIWSTWVRYKEDINEQKVLNYAKEIRSNGFGGQLEIDDHWERCYGSLEPDERKFPDLRRLVEQLKRLHFIGVNLWVHPFVNVNCNPAHSTGMQQGYFVRDFSDQTFMQWWQGPNASYVDFTNPRAVDWYRERLMELRRQYGIDSFKFDGGESGFSPQPSKFHVMDDRHPETIVKEYVKMIASLGTNVHTRVARGTQRYPIFVTMMDRNSNWRRPLGLPTVVTQLLQLNILGYSFVMPDMIGGNFYGEKATGEFFIRYLQANVFMPSMQFSVPPWDFGPMYTALTKKFIDLRSQYIDRIINLMHEHVVTGAPVNPPIWWLDPDDQEALVCDSEFLLGEDLLVAPVLVEGKTSRDIFLPSGMWRDENNVNTELIKGPTWLRDYPADLSVLPYFTRVFPEGESTNISVINESARTNSFTFLYLILIVACALFLILYLCRRQLRLRKRFRWRKKS